MKFDCDSRRIRREEKTAAREAALLEWHRVFAIFPVRIATGDCRFLELVERRLSPKRWEYGARVQTIEYRPYVRR